MDAPSVEIQEVMLRDGLQIISDFIPTEAKFEMCRLIMASGLHKIEVTSFVSPKAIPQFQDAPEVAQAALKMKPEGVEISALVPNLLGAQRALQNGIRRLGFVMSVSESHNMNNVRRTRKESVDELKKVLELRDQYQYPEMTVKAGMACVFGCPFEGKIKLDVTLNFIRRIHEMGIKDISIADTVGFGNPKEVKEMSRLCVTEFPDVSFSIHLHNTRGLGLANSLAAYESGIRIHDGAIGGLGGCPFAPGAKGNTSTEDLVFMFEEMGVHTDVQMDSLLHVSRYFKRIKKDINYSSSILEVGTPAPLGPITLNKFSRKESLS